MEYVKKAYPYLFLETSFSADRPLFQRPLMPLKVDGCNASGDWSFSDASIDVSSNKGGVSEFFAFRGTIQTILKSRACQNTLTSDQKEAFELLGSYLQSECHKKCLQALQKKKPQDRKESEIQAVLALHLFSPLVVKPELLADRTCDEKCCSCGQLVNRGDTSFGNSKVWHGPADILIRRSKVKVAKHVPTEIDEEGCGEPPHKKIRKDSEGSTCTSDDSESDGSCTSVIGVMTAYKDSYMPFGPLKLQTGMHCKVLSQVLAQTIVNAFIQNKKCPALKEHFIPCFLASENHITIHMYNPFYDILLTQGESMSVFSQGKLNIDTIFTVWMALNFDKFPAGRLNENVKETWQTYCKERSGFHNAISSCIDVYRNEMDEPMKHVYDSSVYNVNHCNPAFSIWAKEVWENEVNT